MKIVINRDFGGFGLSEEAHAFIAKRKGWTHACSDYDMDYWYSESGIEVYDRQLPRTDLDLIAAVETLGADANGRYADLKIVEVPDGVDWYIHDYDGSEEVHERHRVWS